MVDADLSNDFLSGRQIAELLDEERAALLVEERGGASLEQCLLETLSCFRALSDFADDATLPEREREAAHGPVGGKGNLNRDRERLRERVREVLLQDGSRQATARLGADPQLAQREFAPVRGDQAAPVGGGFERLRHGGIPLPGVCLTNARSENLVTFRLPRERIVHS